MISVICPSSRRRTFLLHEENICRKCHSAEIGFWRATLLPIQFEGVVGLGRRLKRMRRSRSMKRGERRNDKIHYQFNRHTIEEAEHQRALRQKKPAQPR